MRTVERADLLARWKVAVTRRMWIGAALAAMVLVGALVLYARPGASWRHDFVASASVRIVAISGSAATSYDAYLAQQESQDIARAFASGGAPASSAFRAAVAHSFAAHHAALVARYGAGLPSSVSPGDVAASVTTQDRGDVVMLSCRWSSASGANALLSATVSTLTDDADLRSLLPSGAVATHPDVAVAQPAGEFVPAHLDSAAADAAKQELLARLALAVVFGCAVVLVLAAMSLRSRANGAQPIPAEAAPDKAASGQR